MGLKRVEWSRASVLGYLNVAPRDLAGDLSSY